MRQVIVSCAVILQSAAARFFKYEILGAICAGTFLFGVRPAGAQSEAHPILSGLWSTTTTAVENPGWTIEELFACNCTPETYEYIPELLLPQNDHMSAGEIRQAVLDHNERAIAALMTEAGREYAAAYDLADDPAIQCEYFGVFRSILHNDPILIEQSDDRIVIRAEDMASDRVIFMDGRGHPDSEQLTSLGHSIGWYEGSTLVVETVKVAASLAEDNLAIHNADNARSIERYTLSEDGRRLRSQLTLIDPVMFREPLILENIRLRTPDVQLEDAPCESISGQR